MKQLLKSLVVLLCSVSLVSCSNMSKQDVGVVTGGIAGGVLGSTVGGGSGRILAIAAGTLAGAFIGGAVGKSMDDTDKLKMNQAMNNNNVGQPAYWRNQNTGTSYQVVPVKNVTVDGNQYCREYRTTADIAGKKQQMYGTACRQPDGTWQAVS
jgi:surface antigen